MIHYMLPGTGLFGGIKVGFQFSELLDSLGVSVVVATPDGTAPDWMNTSVPVCSHEVALAGGKPTDPLLFSLPYDYALLKATGRPLYFHCQGTNPDIDPILLDADVHLMTCWTQAREYVTEKAGRQPTEVGISISDVFFYAGEPKLPHVAACMPRRGAKLIERARRAAPGVEFREVDGANEAQVAATMKHSAFYLSTSPDEWFGLPALEAMAAGCAVVSVPVPKAAEYLRDGHNARVVPIDALGRALADLAEPASANEAFALRNAGLATAAGYRLDKQRRRLKQLLGGPLEALAR